MAKTYSIEEIDNINLGRKSIFGKSYNDIRGYTFLGVEDGRLMRLRSATETLLDQSPLTPNITNVQQAITNIYNILNAPSGIQSITGIPPINITSGANPVVTFKYITEEGIIAHAGGLQLNARQLNAEFNFVDIVASTGDSVKALPATPGVRQRIHNYGLNSLNLYPFDGCNFYGRAVNVPLVLAKNNAREIVCSKINEYRFF